MQASYVIPAVPARPRPLRSLLGDSLRRRGGRRALSALWVVLLLSGVGMFAYPFATDLYTHEYQTQLQHDFGSQAYQHDYLLRRIHIGEGLTRLTIKSIGLNVVVVEGSTPAALRAGAGHYVNTPLPGERGNVGIAGHRTTYGRPFNRLDEIKPGDPIQLETPFAVYTYTAVKSWCGDQDPKCGPNPHPVDPSDVGVLAQPPSGYWLTLTTCHPKGSAAQRLVLRAVLSHTDLKSGIKR